MNAVIKTQLLDDTFILNEDCLFMWQTNLASTCILEALHHVKSRIIILLRVGQINRKMNYSDTQKGALKVNIR